jgi:hypothetical protein
VTAEIKVPPAVYVDRPMSEPERRRSVFAGNIHILTGRPAAMALVEWTRTLIDEAFDGHDPLHAQEELGVDEFVARVGPLKSRFTNDQQTKVLTSELARALDYDPDVTYFDLPRLRVVPSGDYLRSGVSYAYQPHRDTWYAHPPCIVNYWMPVHEVVGSNAMSIWPAYWDRDVENTGFNYDEWVRNSRFTAQSQIQGDSRPHPLPVNDIDRSSEIRVCPNIGDMLVFSSCHLHGTAENVSGFTRFSVDFRTVDEFDLHNLGGAVDRDSQVVGSTIPDFLRVKDLSAMPIGDA